MLRQTRLPISLLDEKKIVRLVFSYTNNFQGKKPDILAAESFEYVFGKKARRKRPRLSCDDLSVGLSSTCHQFSSSLYKLYSVFCLQSLVREAETNRLNYLQEKDGNLQRDNNGIRDLTSDPHFKAGSSKRLWNELFKVIDSSDVVLYVLDARDPMGTRSRYIEQYMKKEKPNKHLIFVINKVDLVPVWITVSLPISCVTSALFRNAGKLCCRLSTRLSFFTPV